MTQTEFGKACGVCERTVRFWENGQRTPSGSAKKCLLSLCKSALRKTERPQRQKLIKHLQNLLEGKY